MEQLYNEKLQKLGYSQLVCDIFSDWESVKDEILPQDRKEGSGNGTIHVFLGAADRDLRKEFSDYYQSVENNLNPEIGAVQVKHYFLVSNIISMLGYVCQYYFEKKENVNDHVGELLSCLLSFENQDGLVSTTSLFKLSMGSNKLRPYFKQFESNGVFAKIIRKLLLPKSSYKISLFKNKGNDYAAFWLIGFPQMNEFEVDSNNLYLRKKDNKESNFPSQIIYYGVPGCGKSNKIKEDLKDVPEYNKIRVVFHPEYTNADFMGQILPVVNGGISYKFTPGPFAQIIKRAYLNPNDKFYLVIEEINRGNAAAIFGDTFQLLDRLKPGKTDSLGNDPASPNVNTFTEGWSQYFVQNIDVNDYIRNVVEDNGKYKEPSDLSNTSRLDIKIGSITFTKNTAIRLPPNLSIWATMNTSDQNVFTLDNAFQRRFDMQLVRNEFEKDESQNQFGGYKDADVQKQHDATIAGTNVKWGDFWAWINNKIVTTLKGLSSTEDKRLGVWFVSNVDGKIDKKVFAEKVLKYLWDDAFKFKRPQIFAPEIDTLERLIAAFENPEQGKNPFEVFKDFSNLVSLVAAPPQNNGAANQ